MSEGYRASATTPNRKPPLGGSGMSDRDQEAYTALKELLRRIHLQKLTGDSYLRINANQGGITLIRIVTEETFPPNI